MELVGIWIDRVYLRLLVIVIWFITVSNSCISVSYISAEFEDKLDDAFMVEVGDC